MKFRIGADGEMVAEEKELQPSFVKGALAAHAGKPANNPYQIKAYRDSWDKGYYGVKQGKIVVEEEK